MQVSVVIPAYNAESFIAETIRRAWAQTWPPLEVIVVDDGSHDDTARVAASLGCVVIRQDNGGVCSARNAGIVAARGDWIALLDHDDLWAPNKLERQAAAAALCPEVSCIATDFVRLGADGSISDPCLSEPKYALRALALEHVDGVVVKLAESGAEILRTGWFLFPSSMLIRRDVLMAAGMFRTEQRLCEDVDCFLRVLKRTPLALIREPLWQWREHAGNSSRNFTGIAEGWLRLGQFVKSEPEAYPTATFERLIPTLLEMRRALVAEYTARGDFRNARRVSRTSIGGRLTPTDAALAVVVEFPPSLWSMLRRARGLFRALSFSS